MKDRLINNLGLKLTAILFAVVLWALVVNIDDPVDEATFRSIPVQVLHEEIFTAKASTYRIIDGNDTVNVTVRAKRSVLSEIHTTDIFVTADIKNRVSNSFNEATLPTEVVIRGFEREYLEAYTTPKNIQIMIEASTTKVFPISVETIGTPRDGNIIGELKANPKAVTLGGGESQISRVKKVVAKADVSGISSSGMVEAELILYDVNDKPIDQVLFENNIGKEGLKVDIEVLKTKEVPIEFDISEIKPAQGYDIANVLYEPQMLRVAGTAEDLKELTKISVPGKALKSDGISASKEEKIDIRDYLPKGIQLADNTAYTVVATISVEKYGTKVFMIPANKIILENALSGLKPSIGMMENIEIQVVGSKAALSSLTEPPKVFVDLQKCTTEGNFSVPLQAELPPGCTLMGTARISIILMKE